MDRRLITMVIAVAVVAVAAEALAREPVSQEMRGAAAARGQIEQQVQAASAAAAAVTGRKPAGSLGAPAATPEKEMERRRKLINGAHKDFIGLAADARMPIGMEGAERATAGARDAGGLLVEPSSTGGGRNEEPKGGSARSPDSRIDVAASSADRAIPAPPRAIPVEGSVTVKGGEGNARAPTEGGKDVSYVVEERFVGNLIVAEPIDVAVARGSLSETSDASARSVGGGTAERAAHKAAGREYELDSLSTSIQVRSLDGGVCMEKGGRDGACARSAPFTKFEVSNSNRYGQFNDGVVSAETDGGRVKIDVRAPDVAFSTAGGEAKASLNCSSASFELSESEFRRLIDSGSLTLTKGVGSSGKHAGCVEGSTVTLNLKTKGK